MDVLSIITIILGFSMLLIGLAIWIGKSPDAIAGYDPEKCADPEKLAQTVGVGLTLMGFASMALGLAGELLGISSAPLLGLVAVPVVGVFVLVFLTRGL